MTIRQEQAPHEPCLPVSSQVVRRPAASPTEQAIIHGLGDLTKEIVAEVKEQNRSIFNLAPSPASGMSGSP